MLDITFGEDDARLVESRLKEIASTRYYLRKAMVLEAKNQSEEVGAVMGRVMDRMDHFFAGKAQAFCALAIERGQRATVDRTLAEIAITYPDVVKTEALAPAGTIKGALVASGVLDSES